LAHSLGLRLIAEGVESEDAARELRAMGADEAQGYHFSRPIPAKAFERWLAENDPWPLPGPAFDDRPEADWRAVAVPAGSPVFSRDGSAGRTHGIDFAAARLSGW
jgi:predicted signal transduction protein with EAL and GGDEF domain